MKIQLAEHYGLCFGVRDAIARAEQLAREGPLTILGELVHNPGPWTSRTLIGESSANASPGRA